jgi:hypothetical protein
VTPAFVFELDAEGTVLYNDAIVLEERTWLDLEQQNRTLPELSDLEGLQQRRAESLRRLQNFSSI